ncbi:MAG: A/G-specific adenine glycosylase [Desulfobacterales bacterium]|nr:A/G-specific adenine glycosylase [Desulfobacterales bacterium]
MKSAAINKFRPALINWYNNNLRKLPWRDTDNPYYIWVSEVMLQQTQVNTVIPYYQRFITLFPDIKTLAKSRRQSVLKAWEGMGYYARARNLHKAAQQVVSELNGSVPDDPEQFHTLPGVGDYIMAAVQSIAFKQPLAVVDGNVKRVIARLFEDDTPVNKPGSHKSFQIIADSLLDHKYPDIFNQAMMELGAIICKIKNPDCRYCPVIKFCSSYKHKTTNTFPKRIKSQIVPEIHTAVAVIHKKGRILITKRKQDGLLGGLWEFPGGKIEKSETPDTACIREIREEINLDIEIISHMAHVKHAYTHFKLKMDVYKCRYLSGRVRLNGPVDFCWIKPNETDLYPFPKANHKFMHLI